MLDGDESSAQTLCLASPTVVVIAATILSTDGLVAAVTIDGIAGAAGAQLLHQTHRVKQALVFTELYRKIIIKKEIDILNTSEMVNCAIHQ